MIESLFVDAAFFVGGLGSMAILDAWKRLRQAKASKTYVEPESIKWSWITGPAPLFGKPRAGFLCPSCREYGNNDKQSEKCTCYDFPRAHYHFTCVACAHEAIVRPADDPMDKPMPKTNGWWQSKPDPWLG